MLNVPPEQIVAVLLAITAVGFTETVTVKVDPTQEPVGEVGVTV